MKKSALTLVLVTAMVGFGYLSLENQGTDAEVWYAIASILCLAATILLIAGVTTSEIKEAFTREEKVKEEEKPTSAADLLVPFVILWIIFGFTGAVVVTIAIAALVFVYVIAKMMLKRIIAKPL